MLIRTQIGNELYNGLIANDLIESKKIKDIQPELPLLEKVAKSKRNKCTERIDKKKNEKLRYPRY